MFNSSSLDEAARLERSSPWGRQVMRAHSVLLTMALLAACGQAPQNRHKHKLNAFDVESAADAQASRSTVSAPSIAYSYTVT